jgi:hypothetical protein
MTIVEIAKSLLAGRTCHTCKTFKMNRACTVPSSNGTAGSFEWKKMSDVGTCDEWREREPEPDDY